jgi:hypothetical protein
MHQPFVDFLDPRLSAYVLTTTFVPRQVSQAAAPARTQESLRDGVRATTTIPPLFGARHAPAVQVRCDRDRPTDVIFVLVGHLTRASSRLACRRPIIHLSLGRQRRRRRARTGTRSPRQVGLSSLRGRVLGQDEP